MNQVIWMIILAIFIMTFILQPYLQYKKAKKDKESYLQFQKKLKIGDFVLLSSGILGEVVKMNKDRYLIKIDENVEIEVIAQSVVGIDKQKSEGRLP